VRPTPPAAPYPAGDARKKARDCQTRRLCDECESTLFAHDSIAVAVAYERTSRVAARHWRDAVPARLVAGESVVAIVVPRVERRRGTGRRAVTRGGGIGDRLASVVGGDSKIPLMPA